jgi:aldehyde reductase
MKLNHAIDLQHAKMPLNHGEGQIPALGCGTLIPDHDETRSATRDAVVIRPACQEKGFSL